MKERERQFYNLSLSDADVVKWLIMFRDKVDIYFRNKTDNFYDNAGNVQSMNQELIALYVSLDDLIDKCRFNNRQSKLIELLQKGYTFDGIEELNNDGFRIHGLNKRNSKDLFETICKRIADQNEYDWSIWVHDNYLNTRFKRCSRCKELLPRTNRLFGSDIRNKDKYKSYCKKCDSYTKK